MGLRLKLFIPILLGVVAFTIFIHFFWATEYERKLFDSYQETQLEFIKTIEPEIIRGIISNDIATLNKFLDQQMAIHHKNWIELSLRVKETRFYPLFDYIKSDNKNTFTIKHSITEDGNEELAKISLLIDWSNEKNHINDQTNAIETSIIAILFFMVLASYILQNKIILSPLLKLKHAVHQFQTGHYDTPLATSRKDEIGELMLDFDSMRSQHRINEESLRIAACAFDIYEGILIFDKNKIILQANKSFKNTTGFSDEEILGNQAEFFHSEIHNKEFYEEIWSVVNTQGQWNGEIWHKRKNGEIFPQHTSITAVKNTQGEITHYVASYLDISETKQYQNILKLKAKELEIARDKAEVASQAKSDFLATMSHEIRTPMNGVLGMAQLLAGTSLDDQQTEYLDTINLSGQNLLTIINDILDFSKIEAQKMELEPISFNLHDCGFEVTKLLTSKAREKGLELLFNMNADCPNYTIGDPGRLRQILLNIVGNAIKFTKQGHVLLEILCTNKTQKSADIILRITDTGIGIPAHQQESLFQAFTQADSSTTRKFGGTGLGLSISQQLVALMGGHISVESKEGKGSTFSVKIPLAISNSPEPLPLHDVNGIHLLIVDDNKTNLKILEEQTQFAGITTVSVDNAQDALKILKQSGKNKYHFDVAILDYCMPDMDGAELGDKILSNPATQDLPLILLTSAGHSGDIKRFTELGFSGYLTKPATRKTLIAMISAAINHKQKRQSDEMLTSHSVTETSNLSNNNAIEPQLNNARVLLAEDDPINQQVAIGMLNTLDIHPDIAGSGLEVIEKVKNNHYDLILMDCLMPEMDGFEATKALRDNLNTRNIPIIALTANAQTSDRERCIESGMNDFLAKPFEFDDLRLMIEQWLADPIVGKPQPQTSNNKHALLDLKVFNKLKSDLPEAFDNILNVFLQDTGLRINEITESIQQNQLDTALLLAHSLKSSSASLGAIPLSQCSHSLETAIKQRNIEESTQLANTLKDIFAETRFSIEKDKV